MITSAFISLTTPMMMWGLALISLPLLAHLLNRQARRRIVFPSIRLLRESAANQSQLFKLRRLILLALRCLAVALIVWAFARPVWLNARPPEAGTSDGAGVVVIVDASLSTSQSSDGLALINSIRVAAQRAIDSLEPSRDSADIVFATAHPQAMFDQLSHNLSALRRELQSLQPTTERADFPAAFALAGRLLSEHNGDRCVVIASDMQETNWRDVAGATTSAGAVGSLLPRGTRMTFVDIEAHEESNIALSLPCANPAQPMVGQPMQLIVTVTNDGDRPAQITLSMSLDGQAAKSQAVVLEPWEKQEAAFDATLSLEGAHEVLFSIPSDALTADNRAYLIANAVRHVPVVLVSDDDVQEPGSSGYFITRALAPHGDETDHFEVHHVGSAEVTNESLAGAAAVFVGDIGTLDSTPALAILDYAKAGGGVVMFCGDGPVQRNCLLLDSLVGSDGVLPWSPGAARDFAASGPALHIDSGNWRSQLLRAFDERSQIAMSQITFRRVLAAVDVKPDARVLLTFGDGAPALAARPFGASQIVLANFSPSLHASDLGRFGAFVALLQNLVQELQPQQDMRALPMVGQAYQFPPIAASSGSKFEVRGPDDQPIPSADFVASATRLSVTVPHPDRPGFYHLVRDGQTVSSTAINIDPRESDLRRVDPTALARQLEAAGSNFNIAGLGHSEPVITLRGRPLWNWFVIAAMCMLACEMAFLAMWRR